MKKRAPTYMDSESEDDSEEVVQKKVKLVSVNIKDMNGFVFTVVGNGKTKTKKQRDVPVDLELKV